MKHFFSIILLLVLSMSMVVSVAEQLKCKDLCELKADSDDIDEEIKKEKEKNIYSTSYFSFVSVCTNQQESTTKVISIQQEKFTSELFRSLPELPPEM